MTLGVIGKKVGMTQIFDSEGLAVPVTVIKVDSTVVTQVKTVETDGYNAIQVGTIVAKEKHLTKVLTIRDHTYSQLYQNILYH